MSKDVQINMESILKVPIINLTFKSLYTNSTHPLKSGSGTINEMRKDTGFLYKNLPTVSLEKNTD